ncbi:GtrA family protein [Caballeronia grimmiae]|uniref:GtrA family protein n=1 Tax=Caballeronia grimmiae TaxID=1071679 RepID=UPI0038B8AC7A
MQFLKYLLVGGLNTAVSTAIIFSLQAAGSGLVAANAIGYAVGIAVSFVLNSKFTFKTATTRESALRFLVVVLVSYFCDLGTVLFTLRLTHGALPRAIERHTGVRDRGLHRQQVLGVAREAVAGGRAAVMTMRLLSETLAPAPCAVS